MGLKNFSIQLNFIPGAAGGAQVEEHAAGAAPARVAAADTSLSSLLEGRQEVVVHEGAVVVGRVMPVVQPGAVAAVEAVVGRGGAGVAAGATGRSH